MIASQNIEIGKTITFQGYADDYDKAVVAMQFSLDDGSSWVTHDVSDTTADLWVHWTYSYTPDKPGSYRLRVRSVNDRGRTSPCDAVVDFIVRQNY